MDEEDYKVLRNEADAEPRRYSEWDTHEQFRRQYRERHGRDPSYEEVVSHTGTRQPLSTQVSQEQERAGKQETEVPLSRQSSSSSNSSSSSEQELEEIRTATTSQGRDRRGTLSSQTGPLMRHPTERHPEAITRIETHRTQHAATVGAVMSKRSTAKSQIPLPEMGASKPYPPPLPAREEYVVEYDGVDDPRHAQNWPMRKKLFIGAILAFDALCATVGSSIFSPGIVPLSREFHVAAEVGTLGTSLFVFGYAFGPLVCSLHNPLHSRGSIIMVDYRLTSADLGTNV